MPSPNANGGVGRARTGRRRRRARLGRTGVARAHVGNDVVDGGAGAGPDLEGLQPPVLGQVRRDLEELVVERAARRDRIVLLHREDRVGLAHHPALGELRRRGQILRIAFRRSAARPRDEHVLVRRRQAAIVQELAVRRIVGVPGRHRAVLHRAWRSPARRGARPCTTGAASGRSLRRGGSSRNSCKESARRLC